MYYNDGNSSQWIEFTPGGGGGSSSGLTIQDEGSALSTDATTLNFVGTGVTVTGTGATKTVTVSSGSSLTVAAGAGLTGGGSSGTVTLNAVGGTGITVNADDIELDFTEFSTLDITENTNLYYTNARADARVDAGFTAKSTSDLSEGTNLYYTDARADARIAAADTDNLSEGSTNLYYTDARAQAVSINNVVEDTTPELGGNLDLGTNSIVTASDRNLTLAPDGTGKVVISSPLQVGVFTLPETDGTANQVLITDGSGTLTWAAQSSDFVKAYRYDAVLATNVSTKRIYLHQAFSSVLIDAFVSVAPAGSNATFSIKKNGTSFQTITITDGNTSSVNTNNTTAFAEGDYITVDITAVGSTTAGENLYLVLSFS
jgi:hypothetical protein